MESVSVIIPCFNSQATIGDAIQSVINQTFPVHEIIVVDDGSTDNSANFVSERFPMVTLIKQANMGVSKARNVGIQRATGMWVAFLDADDVWLPEKLSHQFEKLEGCKWSHTNSFYFGYNQSGDTKRSDLSSLKGGNVFDALLTENFLGTSTILVQRDVLLKSGGFDESMRALEDWKLWLDIAADFPISYISAPLVKYRVTPGSASRNAREVYPYHRQLISYAITKIKGGYLRQSTLKRKALSKSNLICSYIAEDGEDYNYAITCALRSLYLQPLKISLYKRLISLLLFKVTK
ncbi:glycosyltransferase [Alteromonas sp. 345S023]|uniref:Glycosyltransferase n=1 Tax=Alteromonas profundi TaxID=2696062 RepID=A0A7X5LL72_9ALTE|nr:glycosyltransferase family A protein [Alteromonas profundi]NDV91402.1 glycosyltransferase [Alteromonas profundi]